jgi:two-component system sensor histidine kinase DegS
VEIHDDGVGFVETELKKHFGLKSMRERTESVNGRIRIESKPGAGTRITLCLPMASQAKQEVANAQEVAS